MLIDMSLIVCVCLCDVYTCMDLLSDGIHLHIFVILEKQKGHREDICHLLGCVCRDYCDI